MVTARVLIAQRWAVVFNLGWCLITEHVGTRSDAWRRATAEGAQIGPIQIVKRKPMRYKSHYIARDFFIFSCVHSKVVALTSVNAPDQEILIEAATTFPTGFIMWFSSFHGVVFHVHAGIGAVRSGGVPVTSGSSNVLTRSGSSTVVGGQWSVYWFLVVRRGAVRRQVEWSDQQQLQRRVDRVWQCGINEWIC